MDQPKTLEFELLVAVAEVIGYRIGLGFRTSTQPGEAGDKGF